MKTWSRLTRALAVVLLVLASTIGFAPATQAAAGNILPPFTIGEQWWICQGYNNPAVTHHDNGPYATNPRSMYGLDLTSASGCNSTASAGKTVRAPLAGTATYSSGSGTLCINSPDGRSIALTHIDSSVNGAVSAGQEVGTVAAAGHRSNGGIAHIHLQIWSSHGCWSTGNGGMPFDSGHNAQICGAPNLTANGPNGGNGTWSGESITGAQCSSSSTDIERRPSAISMPDGSLNVFAIATNGHLYQNVWNSSGWTGWLDRGTVSGGLTGSPFALLAPDGSLNVFAFGGGSLYQNVWSPADGWTGWINRGTVPSGFSVGSPYAVQTSGGLNIFGISIAGNVYQNVYNAGTWTGWINRGTASTGFWYSPAAINMPDGSLNVFAVSGTGHLYQNVWNTSGWTGWIDKGKPASNLSSTPVVVENRGGLNVFVTGGDHLWQNVWTPSGGWSNWIDRGMGATSLRGTPDAFLAPDGSLNVFASGTESLYQNVWTSINGWTGWIIRGGMTGGLSSSVDATPTPGGVNVFGISGEGSIHQNVYSTGNWTGWINRGAAGGGF